MKKPEEVLNIFEKYRNDLRGDLEECLNDRESCDWMYDMIRYFFGWLDEDLNPVDAYGGKQFRGSLCLYIADAISGDYKKVLPVASSVELFHNFTLIHDDIEDNDPLRRGRPTVWKLWGLNHGINTGDALFLLSLKSLPRLDHNAEKSIDISRFLKDKYLEVVEGQHLDFNLEELKLGDINITEDKYLEMIKKKTSVLVGAATKSGAMVASDDEDLHEKFYNYGLNLGLAYQLCDDLVSIWGKEDLTGKIRYNDIRCKKKTLPVIKLFNKIKEEDRQILVDIFNKEKIEEVDAEKVVELLDKYDIYNECWKRVSDYKEKAREAIKDLDIKANFKNELGEIVEVLSPDVRGVKV